MNSSGEGKEEKKEPTTLPDTKRESSSSKSSVYSSSSSSSRPSEASALNSEIASLLNPQDDHFTMKLQASSQVALKDLARKSISPGTYYSAVETTILRHLDHLDGISSSVVRDPEKYATGIAFYRDATHAKPFSERLSPDNPKVETQNMLLRALNTLRGIDHVLATRELKEERMELLKNFSHLIATVSMAENNDAIKKAHKQFNTALIHILHKNKLDEGLASASDYIGLLNHYRDLASTLDAAKSVVTITRDNLKDAPISQVIHTEIAHPITIKTSEQKAELAVMKSVGKPLSSTDEKANFHNVKPIAFQIADAAFADLIAMDDRRLPAQTRKTIGPTAKNAYLVENELSFEVTHKGISLPVFKREFWSLRCGSPVFIGKGANASQLEKQTDDIFKQLETTANYLHKRALNFTMLVTDSSSEHQDRILQVSKKICDETGHTWVHAPSNVHGQAQPIKALTINPNTKERTISSVSGRDLFSRKTLRFGAKTERIMKAANHMLDATSDEKINVTFCASGQDRTGTVQETATQLWAAQQYKALDLPAERVDMERVRAPGLHNPFLASFAAPGSMGMKNDSRAWNHFLKDTDKYFYRSSAETNKKNPVDKEVIEKMLVTPLVTSPRSELKEEKKEDDIYDRIIDICNSYTKATHAADYANLLDNVLVIKNDTKKSSEEKLNAVMAQVKTIWDKGVKKYAKKNSLYPNDDLIRKLNLEHSDHTTLRRLGDFLQTYKKLSETGLHIIPQEAVFTKIPAEEINDLRNYLKQFHAQLKTEFIKTPALSSKASYLENTLDWIEKKLLPDLEKKPNDETFTKTISLLNNAWINIINKEKSIFEKNPSKKIITKLNTKEGMLYERGIATLLQTIAANHPGMLYPPVEGLTRTTSFAPTIKSTTPKPST